MNTIPADDPQYNTCIVDKRPEASGATSSVSGTPSSADSKTKDDPPNEQNRMIDTSDTNEEDPMDGVMDKKSKGYSYYPLLHYEKNLDNTFYYQYFKPYSHDYRMLRMELLKSSIWMSLLITSFRTTFSMKGGHQIINPYFKNLPSVVRRNLHVAVIRCMEQKCTCQNHVTFTLKL